jgi:hypothetical protein
VGGGGGTGLAVEARPELEGLGGGGGALPGVVGGGGTFRLGDCAGCKLERGGMAGTGRDARIGMEGGLPNEGGFASNKCEQPFYVQIVYHTKITLSSRL